MARSNPNLHHISESLKDVTDLVSRNDEKLKSVISEQDRIKKSIDNMENKTHDLQLKVESANTRIGSHDAKWTLIVDMLWKLVLMIMAGYILYALGLQADLAFPSP